MCNIDLTWPDRRSVTVFFSRHLWLRFPGRFRLVESVTRVMYIYGMSCHIHGSCLRYEPVPTHVIVRRFRTSNMCAYNVFDSLSSHRETGTSYQSLLGASELWNHVMGTSVPPPAPRVRAPGIATVAADPILLIAAMVAVA